MQCPDCGHEMHKSGFVWSGKKKVQRYKCNNCGRTTIKSPEVTDGHTEVSSREI